MLKLTRTETGYRHASGGRIERYTGASRRRRQSAQWFRAISPDGETRGYLRARLQDARADLARMLGIDVAAVVPHSSETYETRILETDACKALARGETNDCTVRALAVWAAIPYSEAHAIMAQQCHRQARKGCQPMYAVERLGRRVEIKVNYCEVSGDDWRRRSHFRTVSVTLASFIKQHPRGRFYVTVRGHALAIVDGIVHDWDARLSRRIDAAWEF